MWAWYLEWFVIAPEQESPMRSDDRGQGQLIRISAAAAQVTAESK